MFPSKELCFFASVKGRSVNLGIIFWKQSYYEFRRETTKETDNTSKNEESYHENKKDKLTASDKGSWYNNLTSKAYPGECLLVITRSSTPNQLSYPLHFSGSLSQSTFRYISVFLLQQINLTPKHYSPANFNWSWLFCYGDCLLRWQGCVPLVNGITALITSLMCCHPGCHKVEKLYRPNTWAFLSGFPYLRQINRVCKSVNEFLRNLA